ncbi:MAG: glucosylglycerol hydrolase [Halothece sp.]
MVVQAEQTIQLLDKPTQELLNWAVEIDDSDLSYLEKGAAFARRLGAHYREDGLTEIGFWTPELTGEVMRPRAIYLEIFTPTKPVDFQAKSQTLKFKRDRVPLCQQGEYLWGVYSGMQPGNRQQLGSLYWLRYVDPREELLIDRDVVPYSLPYGVFGPAEVYDLNQLQKERPDLPYFQETAKTDDNGNIPRVPAPNNILQLHVGTASAEGTFAGLTRVYQTISNKLAQGEPLTPTEENYIGYDAVQLLPIEPTIEYRDDDSPISEFFNFEDQKTDPPDSDHLPLRDEVEIEVKKPNTQDWGYDVPILGSSATNSAILGSLRPHEVIDFIATLHNFATGPIQIIYDLVYGHADNQAEFLINRQFLKGPNMYGQDLNHQLPTVRAIFLEMQRRKLNTGADGIRVDGGQDFRFFNPLSGRVEQDDAYLLAMSDVVQEIGENKRLMFTIFEDGRPWPAPGWEEISTYRDLINLKPESYQWGPLIFAHNTPALAGFWERKWRRVTEVMFEGDRWITGCANHDTVRRGNQIDPNEGINWNLGKTLPEVLGNAYDNPATNIWIYGFSPGIPMDFINSLMHAPWMFFRNTDERYGVKVVSEEVGFLDWQITEEIYNWETSFPRLKSLGFETLEQLREFGKALQTTMIERDYDLNAVIEAYHSCLGENTDRCEFPLLMRLNRPEMMQFLREIDIPKLKEFALKFMEDCYEICNVAHYGGTLGQEKTAFNLNLRQFRKQHPWLSENLIPGSDRFNKVSEETHTVFYGVRSNPHSPEEQVAMVTHMGGDPITVTLGDWLQLDLNHWKIAITSPGLEVDDLSCFELKDSQGLLLHHLSQT